MKRLTEKRRDQYFVRANYGDATMIYAPGADPAQRFEGGIIDRLAAIEDILGDEYDLDELKEVVQAKREGRCVVLPEGGCEDKDGENALKSAMNTCFYHNNPVTRFIADAVAEKLTRQEAQAALRREQDGNNK